MEKYSKLVEFAEKQIMTVMFYHFLTMGKNKASALVPHQTVEGYTL